MTRARKYNWAEIEHVYVHDVSPKPISIDGLVEQYGVTRSLVAYHAARDDWAKKRADFRQIVGTKIIESMTDTALAYASAQQEKVIQALVKTLDAYITRLENGEIKPGIKDMVAVSAALRVYLADRMAATSSEAETVDPETMDINPADLKLFIEASLAQLRALPSGEEVADDADLPDAGAGT
jgi:hypothetical protein